MPVAFKGSVRAQDYTLAPVLKLPLGTVRRGGKAGHMFDPLTSSATGVKPWAKEVACLGRQSSQEEEQLEFVHKQVRTPGSELVWLGLADSHKEAELPE